MGRLARPRATPAAKPKFKYKCMLLNGLENFVDPSIVPLSERKDLPEEAKALLLTVDNLPTKGGIKTSRWYTPLESELTLAPSTPSRTLSISPSPPPTPLTSTHNSSILNPAAEEFATAGMECTAGNSKSTNATPERGLTTSRWAQSAGSTLGANTSAMVGPSAMPPVKARDIPVHLRGYYIPPHLRPVGQKATPGKPLLPYIEPHQRVGILPEVIPNDAEDQTCAVPQIFSVTNSENPETHEEKSFTSVAAKKSGYLASSWEEFIGGKSDFSSTKQLGPQPIDPFASTSNVIRRVIHLPPDCFSTKLAPDRDIFKLQKKNTRDNNMTGEALQPASQANTSFTGKHSQSTIKEKVEQEKQPELVEPKTYSTAEMPLSDTDVHQTPHEYIKDVQEVILYEVRNPQPAILDLTREALIHETGAAPKDSAGSSLDGFVSDDGVGNLSTIDNVKSFEKVTVYAGDSRGYLAEKDNNLQQFDGTWMPAPISWEEDRSGFNNSFIHEYIATWIKTVVPASGKIDTNRDEFKSGLSPLCHLKFDEPVSQPLSYPDIANSDNVNKQRFQTADIDAKAFVHKEMKKQRIRRREARMEAQRQPLFPVEEEVITNPNTPKIAIYLRPAQEKDIPGITSIYNHYVLNSTIPEDQVPVREERMQAILTSAREQELPFIVAIKGQPPPGYSTNSIEQVLGFAHTDFYNYGHGGTHTGLSRFTGVIQLYVEPNHTRKGVGRSLMDRILVCSSFAHASKEGYDWVIPNPSDTAVYGRQGGAHRFHQLLIHRPIETRADPDHAWLKQWLHSKFFIEEVARLRSVARSLPRGTTARFLDLLTFQYEAAIPGAFDITN